MYGKNNLSNSKFRALDAFSKGKDFGDISHELSATVEVYTILIRKPPVNIVTEGLSGLLRIAEESFNFIFLRPPQSLNSPSTKFALFWLE